jgi:hypothetical protein
VSRDPAPVCRGVAFLDKHVPGWEKEIDLDDLDLQMGDRCVLGQLYFARHPRSRAVGITVFDRMLGELGIRGLDDDKYDEAEKLGFIIPWRDDYDITDAETRFGRLTTAWKRVIRRRLKTA